MNADDTLPHLPRRALLARLGRAALLLPAAGLAGCGSSPPVQLYRLRSEPPEPVALPPPSGDAVQLLLPVRVPEYLDRESLLLPQPGSGVLALSGHRWAESLRDAVPRVLLSDLSTRLGEGRVWSSPLPAGVKPARQLRVELLALEAQPDRQAVSLMARWTWTDPDAATPPRSHGAQLRVPAASPTVDALVDAHRLALWQLSGRVAATR